MFASQATSAIDAAMNGGPGIPMSVLQSALHVNPRIGTSQGDKRKDSSKRQDQNIIKTFAESYMIATRWEMKRSDYSK